MSCGVCGICRDYHKAECRQEIRAVDPEIIRDITLHRCQNSSSEYRHDKTAGSYLAVIWVFASGYVTEGEAVYGREHKAHERTHQYQGYQQEVACSASHNHT